MKKIDIFKYGVYHDDKEVKKIHTFLLFLFFITVIVGLMAVVGSAEFNSLMLMM